VTLKNVLRQAKQEFYVSDQLFDRPNGRWRNLDPTRPVTRPVTGFGRPDRFLSLLQG